MPEFDKHDRERVLPLEEIVPEYRSKNPWVRRYFHSRFDWAVRVAGETRGARIRRILDAGTGEGLLLPRLAVSWPGAVLYGVDFNAHLGGLPRTPPVRLMRADVRSLPLRPVSVDLAFGLDVLEHIPDVERAISELHRVLVPEGALVLSLPDEDWVYKIARFAVKGTLSAVEGPGTGVHYHGLRAIQRKLRPRFELLREVRLPRFLPCGLSSILALRRRP